MAQGTRRLFIVIIAGLAALALGAGAIRPAPARGATASIALPSAPQGYVALGDSYSAGDGVPPYGVPPYGVLP